MTKKKEKEKKRKRGKWLHDIILGSFSNIQIPKSCCWCKEYSNKKYGNRRSSQKLFATAWINVLHTNNFRNYNLKAANPLYGLKFHSHVTCMPFVCAHFIYMYSFAICTSLVCTRISSICHPYILICHPYVTCWSFYLEPFPGIIYTFWFKKCFLFNVIIGKYFFIKIYYYPEVWWNHLVIVFFETNFLKEVLIIHSLSSQ